jgi:hypothetical protein
MKAAGATERMMNIATKNGRHARKLIMDAWHRSGKGKMKAVKKHGGDGQLGAEVSIRKHTCTKFSGLE